MNLANKLTFARLAMIPAVLCFLLGPVTFERGGFLAPYLEFADETNRPLTAAVFRTVALLVTIAAALTDWFDGKIARERNMVTPMGELFDPLADKMLVTAAFVAFVELNVFPSWLIIIIVCREFLVSGIRMLGATRGRVIPADRWGKHKTGWQLATIITTIVFLAARDYLRAFKLWDEILVRQWDANIIYHAILHVLLLIAVAFTLASGWRYVKLNRDLLEDSPQPQ